MKYKPYPHTIILLLVAMLLSSCGFLEVEIAQGEELQASEPMSSEPEGIPATSPDPVPTSAAIVPAESAPQPTLDPFAPVFLNVVEGEPGFTRQGWMIFESEDLNLRMELPALADPITYTYAEWPTRDFDPTGTEVSWVVYDPSEEVSRPIIGCVSEDYQMGREGFPTDAIRWTQEGSQTFIEYPLGKKLEVTPLRVVAHPQGVEGLIVDPNDFFFTDEMLSNPERVDRLAILNFPEGYHPKLECLAFYFYDETSLDTLEEVLLSVEFLSGEGA